MALLIGDNFSYNGKKPNFERDSFETLAILKAFPEANIDNGHIAYCKETNKHYIFNDSNSIDPSTGKWRALESEFSNLVDLDAYLTKEEAQSTYQSIGDYALKSDLDNLVTKDEIPSLDEYATEVWVNSQGFLKSIPEEYITESELDAKDYVTNTELDSKQYLTETELEDKNYATKDEIPDISNLALKSEILTKVSQLENDSNFLTSIPEEYVTDAELQEAISGVQFELPIATDSVLGGIKVGAGLSINPDTGILSATGGGTADAVEWDNVFSKPSWITENKPVYNYSEIEGNIPVSKLPIATTESVGVIKVGDGLTIDGSGLLSATGGGIADSVDWDNVTNKPQINGHELIGGNNTLDSLGIQPVGDYALKSEIPSLNGYATESWVSSQGYLTSIPSEYVTEDKLNSKGYLTSVPDNYVTDSELTEAINDVKYTLPTASTDTLGGIKVGAGLSITGDGILSATGGGVADSVAWENVVGRPTNLSQFTNDSGFITSDDLPDLSNYALKSEIPDLTNYALKSEIPIIPTNISVFINDSGYITSSALTDYAKKSEIPDISGLATKSELSGYALVKHTHVVADITDFPEIPDVSNLATKTELAAKQDELISGINIKTINGTSLLGSGNIVIEASGGGSEITDVLDEKTYARTKGSWVDLTNWLEWAEYD